MNHRVSKDSKGKSFRIISEKADLHAFSQGTMFTPPFQLGALKIEEPIG